MWWNNFARNNGTFGSCGPEETVRCRRIEPQTFLEHSVEVLVLLQACEGEVLSRYALGAKEDGQLLKYFGV